MAEENDEDLELELADAGVAFRAEMWATNFMMGYWKHVLAVLIVGLLAILLFTQYQDYTRKAQRTATYQISKVETSLEMDSKEARCAAANALNTIAEASNGTAKVEALLKASELFRLCENPEEQRRVLTAASAKAESVLKYSAIAALANLDLEEGKGDSAIERMTSLRDSYDGFLAQRAAIDLGLALEHLKRFDDAQAVYAEFLTTWPDSPRADEVRSRQAAKGADVVPEPAPPAPAPVEEADGDGEGEPQDGGDAPVVEGDAAGDDAE